MNIKLECRVCGMETTNCVRKINGFSIFAYEDSIRWSELENEIPELGDDNDFDNLLEAPKVGERRVVQVRMPFDEPLDGHFWTVFYPPSSVLSGWEESLEEIDKSAFLKCCIREVLLQEEHQVWAQVEVIEKISLSDAHMALSLGGETAPIINCLYPLEELELHIFNDWILYSGVDENIEHGNWLLFKRLPGSVRLIACQEWSPHGSYAYLCNIKVSEETLTTLEGMRTYDPPSAGQRLKGFLLWCHSIILSPFNNKRH